MGQHYDIDYTYIQTVSGRQFNILDPRQEDVISSDIAWSLSQQQRFTGHTTAPVTIADHSLRVRSLCKKVASSQDTLDYALIHDAHETYVGDLSAPLKRALSEVCGEAIGKPLNIAKIIEGGIDAALFKKYNLNPSEQDRYVVKQADTAALIMERDAWMKPCPVQWHCSTEIEFPMDLIPASDDGGFSLMLMLLVEMFVRRHDLKPWSR